MAKTPLAEDPQQGSVFVRENYILFFVGIAVIVVGFLLMAGGAPESPNEFDPGEVYSPRRITLAPIVVILGFLIEIVAIFRRPKR